MSEAVRQTLARVVAQYGREIADDPRRCEGLLRDLCGDSRREIHVLLAALKEKAVSELLSGGDVPAAVLVSRGVKRLHEHTGIAEDVARWGVESWALALGVVAPETVAAPARQQPTRPAAAPPGPTVQTPAASPAPSAAGDQMEDGLGVGCVCFLGLFIAATVVGWCCGLTWTRLFGVVAGVVLGVAVLTLLVAPRHKDSVSGPTVIWSGLLGGPAAGAFLGCYCEWYWLWTLLLAVAGVLVSWFCLFVMAAILGKMKP